MATRGVMTPNTPIEMTQKKIDLIAAPAEPHWVGDGFLMHNFIPYSPGLSMRQMDPFIMLDYGSPIHVRPTARPHGVGVHPHRGFETVTIAYHGEAEHHDSRGYHGVLRQGDVQWMTAGAGVLHKEYHAADWSHRGGLFQMVQLWVNLPAKDKMTAPTYQALANSSLARVPLKENDRDCGYVEVIAGEYRGVRGPARTFSPLALMNIRLKPGAKAEFSLPESWNVALLAVEGDAAVDGHELPEGHLLKFAHSGTEFSVEAIGAEAKVLLLGGEPLDEPIAAYGPFVMNTQAQIQQAIQDMNRGAFGYLED